MKKLFLILCVAMFALTSCQKEDNDSLQLSDIVGKWSLKEIYSEKSNKWIPVAGTSYASWYAQFNKDYSYTSDSGTDYKGTFKISGQKVICDVKGTIITYYLIELNGNSVVMDMEYDNDGDKIRMKATR